MNRKTENRLVNTERWLPEGKRVGGLIKIGEVDEEVQISSYKINVTHIWASLMAQW